MMFIAVFRRLWQAVKRGWADPVFRSLLLMTVTLLLGGAWLFHRVEGWTYFQSL